MHSSTRLLSVTLVCFTLLPCALLAQGPPPPPPPPPPAGPMAGVRPLKTGTARLSGRVIALDTGRPLRRAVVTASSADVMEGKSISTDAEGRWELRDLPAGRFSVSVSKGGYVTLAYGQRRPFEPGKPIELADKQSLDKIDFALPRGSAVTGRVVDEFGDAVTGVRVSAMRYRFNSGQRRLTPTGATDTTDDLGQFRLFGLAPGEYYIAAQPVNVGAFLSSSADRTGYAQTFYPNSFTAGEATKVALTIGQEAQNLVIALSPTRLANLSGTLAKADGKPIVAGTVRLQEITGGPSSLNMGIVRPDGTWNVSGVAPGEYRLTASAMERSFEEIASTGGVGGMQFAQMTVSVNGEDISGLALTTSTGGSVEGSFKFEGAAAPGPPPLGAMIMAADTSNTGIGMAAAGTIKPDWSFQLSGLTGKRTLRPFGLPKGWSVKSIIVDGADVIDTPIDVPPGGKIEGVEVRLTQGAAAVSGTVQTDKGTATSDFVVLLFPSDAAKWEYPSRFVRTARPDQTGRFVIDDVPAASYLAVALEYLEPGEEGNPDLLESLRSTATSVTVGDGEKKTLTLKLPQR